MDLSHRFSFVFVFSETNTRNREKKMTSKSWTSVTFAALVFLILSEKVAADDFTSCFCYQTNGRWCDGTAVGSSEFWRDSCKNWVTDALLWTIPAFLALLFFFFFPFIFCAARVCCNCCGGREPTDGCCCPTNPGVRVTPEGTVVPQTKQYSNRSVFCTKFLLAAVFGLWVYYSVGIFVINHRVSNGLLDVIGSINSEMSSLYETVAAGQNASNALAANGATFVDATALQSELQSALSKYQTVVHDVAEINNHIHDAELNEQIGRNEDAYRIPAIGLCILFPAFIMMLCNCRGVVLTIGAGLMSFAAVLVVGAFIAHEVVAQGSTALCNNYNTTLVPSLINAATWGGGCGGASITQRVSDGAEQYFEQACSSGVATLCGESGAFTCPPGAYDLLCVDGQSSSGNVASWSHLLVVLNSTFFESVNTEDANCPSGCSISVCANQCASLTSKSASQQFQSFFDAYQQPVQVLVNDFFAAYYNCTGIYEALQSTSIHGNLCNEFSTQFTNISIQFLALSVLAIPAIILLIMGAKRFTKMTPLSDNSHSTNIVYQVMVQNDEERAIVGSPLLAPRPNNDHAMQQSEYGGYGVPVVGVLATQQSTCTGKVVN